MEPDRVVRDRGPAEVVVAAAAEAAVLVRDQVETVFALHVALN
jgi:hypothetical protein